MSHPISLNIETPKARQTLHIPHAHAADPLSEHFRRAHLPLNTRCGQRGHCDGCTIELLAGSLLHTTTHQPLHASDKPISLRACEYRLAPTQPNPVTLRAPARALLAYEPLVESSFRINIPRAHDPLFQHLQLRPAPPDALLQQIADQRETNHPIRLSDHANSRLATLNASATATLHATLEYRGHDWLVTDLSPDTPADHPLGAAIDIGTTTVALLLVDLTNGQILARSAMFNQQMNLGDDVVTRITLCTHDKQMVRQLQSAVAEKTILPLLHEALAKTATPHARVATLCIAGNTTMQHLLAGVDPTPLGVAPFTPEFLDHRIEPASPLLTPPSSPHCLNASLPQCLLPTSSLHLLPSAAAYIGSDLTAGVLASGLLYDDGPSLLVDIGTNGEIILKHRDQLLGTATAAGPAFEGAGLACGIRAGDGAISIIKIHQNPLRIQIETIGAHAKPIGLCGSAYIDFLAQARRAGLLTETGRFATDAIPPELLDLSNRCNPAFKLAASPSHGSIVVAQTDIANLLPAKAAIAAGILILLKNANLQPSDIKRLYLAGGFGTHMNCQNAISCGLLPGFTPSQIQPVGNTALAGAYLALLDSSVIDEITRVGRSLRFVELNHDPDFESHFIDQLLLP